MTLASDNVYPKVIISEAAAPASPSAGQFKLYVDSSDHLLKYKNSSGTVVTLGAGVADMGTATYFDFTTGSAPASPSAGKVRLYSLTGDHLYQKDSSGTATALDSGGGGGATQAFVGYNTIGGSTETPGINSKSYAKQITTANACLFSSIDAHIAAHSATTSIIGGVAIFADNAGAPGILLAGTAPANLLQFGTTFGWFSMPVGAWLAAGTYWIAIRSSDTGAGALTDIKYDGSGSDVTWTGSATQWISNPGSLTTTSNKYSIRANTIR